MRRLRLSAGAAWWALCALHLLPGAAAALAPTAFADLVGLSAAEPHWVRDVGVGELTVAAAAAAGALRRGARPALVVVLGVQLVLHGGSHLVDGVGGLVVPSLLLQALLLSVAARSAAPARARGAWVPARP